jgi:hypothetical protein
MQKDHSLRRRNPPLLDLLIVTPAVLLIVAGLVIMTSLL